MLKVGCFSLTNCRCFECDPEGKKNNNRPPLCACERRVGIGTSYYNNIMMVCIRAFGLDNKIRRTGVRLKFEISPPDGRTGRDDSSNYVFQLHIDSKAFSSPLIYGVRAAAAISDEIYSSRWLYRRRQ